jgi:hypothetical protein
MTVNDALVPWRRWLWEWNETSGILAILLGRRAAGEKREIGDDPLRMGFF